MPARHYLVRGRVQGVGYRYFALDAAERLGIKGYGRNLPTGAVEVHAETEEAGLAAFKRVLEQGPGIARGTDVVENNLPLSGSYLLFVILGCLGQFVENNPR